LELARVIRELRQRRWLLALGLLIAAGASIFIVHKTPLQYSAASTQVLVDANASVLGDDLQSTEALSARAEVYANFMASPAILDIVGRQVGLSGEQIYAAGPVNAAEPRVEQEPTALKRNLQLTGETKPYRLNYEAQGNLPTITIYSQAPTTTMAVALANAAVVGLQRYVARAESTSAIPKSSRIVIRQLGPASGGVVDGSVSKTLAAMVFAAVFLLWCALLLYGARFRVAWRESAAAQDAGEQDRSAMAARGEEHCVGSPEETPLRAASSHELDNIPSYIPSRGDDDRAAPVPARRVRR
jgi:hypothetical protein